MGAWQSNERGRHLEVKKEVKATALESFHFAYGQVRVVYLIFIQCVHGNVHPAAFTRPLCRVFLFMGYDTSTLRPTRALVTRALA